eukprot:COSAG02_NODE_1482_length_12387_cov_6.381348_4_plen_48_part_00
MRVRGGAGGGGVVRGWGQGRVWGLRVTNGDGGNVAQLIARRGRGIGC